MNFSKLITPLLFPNLWTSYKIFLWLKKKKDIGFENPIRKACKNRGMENKEGKTELIE